MEGRDDEIAFVFSPFVIHDDQNFTTSENGQGVLHRIKDEPICVDFAVNDDRGPEMTSRCLKLVMGAIVNPEVQLGCEREDGRASMEMRRTQVNFVVGFT